MRSFELLIPIPKSFEISNQFRINCDDPARYEQSHLRRLHRIYDDYVGLTWIGWIMKTNNNK